MKKIALFILLALLPMGALACDVYKVVDSGKGYSSIYFCPWWEVRDSLSFEQNVAARAEVDRMMGLLLEAKENIGAERLHAAQNALWQMQGVLEHRLLPIISPRR